jgi:hypothetical protein
MRNATDQATAGVAIDVQLFKQYHHHTHVLKISEPGAEKSTKDQ